MDSLLLILVIYSSASSLILGRNALLKAYKMDQTNNVKISDLKRAISALKWDLNIVQDKKIKAQKELRLRLCEQELEQLLKPQNNTAS